MKEKNDLAERLFQFAIKAVEFSRTIPHNIENNVIRYQLTKAATSAGANYEEAQAGSSRPDFNAKVDISLREMRESNYWLRMLQKLQIGDANLCGWLVGESRELKLILGSIASKTSK
jgi:four helix bundle protein